METERLGEIANYHEVYDYVYQKDPRDPTGNTPLKDANGDPIPERYQSGPFKGEPIVDRSKPPVAIKNNGYDMLTASEQNATRQAYAQTPRAGPSKILPAPQRRSGRRRPRWHSTKRNSRAFTRS
jgi:hypothetical protein